MDCSPPDPSVHGIFQARILECVAISSSRGSSQLGDGSLCLLHWQVDSLPLYHLDLAKLSSMSFVFILYASQDFPVAQTVKNLPAMQETRVQFLGWEVPLEKGMAIHSNILAWRIPWTEKPGRLQSLGSQRVGHD